MPPAFRYAQPAHSVRHLYNSVLEQQPPTGNLSVATLLHCIVPGHFPPYNPMHARGGLPNFAMPLVFNGPGGALGLTACADGVGCKVFMALNGWLPMDSLTETELLKHG